MWEKIAYSVSTPTNIDTDHAPSPLKRFTFTDFWLWHPKNIFDLEMSSSSHLDLDLTPPTPHTHTDELFWIWSVSSPILTLTYIWSPSLTFDVDLHLIPPQKKNLDLECFLTHLWPSPLYDLDFCFQVSDLKPLVLFSPFSFNCASIVSSMPTNVFNIWFAEI